MPVYSICDLALASNVALPELPGTAERPADYVFELVGARPQPAPSPAATIHRWLRPDGEVWLYIEKHGEGYRLHYPNLADFEMAHHSHIRCVPNPNCAGTTIRHLLLDQVLPLALNLRGETVLHASAVVIDGMAVVFVGETGAGKSTIAASFALQDAPLLADDWLLVRQQGGALCALPSYPSVRLWDAAVSALFESHPAVSNVAQYTEKKRVDLSRTMRSFCEVAVPIKKLYFLQPAEDSAEVTIRRYSPRDAVVQMVKNSYQMDITDKARLRTEFRRMGDSVASRAIAHLRVPRSFVKLHLVNAAIRHDLGCTEGASEGMTSQGASLARGRALR